jgi:hypothetical protein
LWQRDRQNTGEKVLGVIVRLREGGQTAKGGNQEGEKVPRVVVRVRDPAHGV